MLARGDIDALYAPREPSSLGHGARRLWSDYVSVERAYFERTRIFPIMHVIVIRRDLYERHPWVAQALYKAFVQAQAFAYADLRTTAALKTMLPWARAEEEDTRALMGDDYWPYGFTPNEAVIDIFTRYSYEQGLSREKRDPRSLFAPETLAAYSI